MRSPLEIRREIRELRAEMKADGIKVSSFLNRHPSLYSSRCNERLFALKIELDESIKASARED